MSKLETIEWTNIWYGNTGIEKKILLLGDSITESYHPFVDRELRNEYCIGKHKHSSKIFSLIRNGIASVRGLISAQGFSSNISSKST